MSDTTAKKYARARMQDEFWNMRLAGTDPNWARVVYGDRMRPLSASEEALIARMRADEAAARWNNTASRVLKGALGTYAMAIILVLIIGAIVWAGGFLEI